MASYVKNKLKAAKEAIGKKDYQASRDAALGVLEYEPENYTAYACIFISYLKPASTFEFISVQCRNVFLALSLLNLGETDRSEQVTRIHLFRP